MLESFVQKEKIRGRNRDSCLSEGILERSPGDNCRRIPFFSAAKSVSLQPEATIRFTLN